MGVRPANAVNPAQSRMMAKRAAVVDAYRQLAEAVKGVRVDAETTVENMMVSSDVVRTKVSAVIQGAKIVSERMTPDGGYEVVMQIPMFGVSGSISSSVITPPTSQPVEFPQPVYTDDTPKYPSQGGYTGLIIDCRGLGLNPVMSPVIENANGVKLYGHQNLDYDRIVREGMVNYVRSTDSTGIARAGSNPLIIKAEALRSHNATPVVSVADGNRILAENAVSGFLGKTAVVFLR